MRPYTTIWYSDNVPEALAHSHSCSLTSNVPSSVSRSVISLSSNATIVVTSHSTPHHTQQPLRSRDLARSPLNPLLNHPLDAQLSPHVLGEFCRERSAMRAVTRAMLVNVVHRILYAGEESRFRTLLAIDDREGRVDLTAGVDAQLVVIDSRRRGSLGGVGWCGGRAWGAEREESGSDLPHLTVAHGRRRCVLLALGRRILGGGALAFVGGRGGLLLERLVELRVDGLDLALHPVLQLTGRENVLVTLEAGLTGVDDGFDDAFEEHQAFTVEMGGGGTREGLHAGEEAVVCQHFDDVAKIREDK
jgi:hypothetical protein